MVTSMLPHYAPRMETPCHVFAPSMLKFCPWFKVVRKKGGVIFPDLTLVLSRINHTAAHLEVSHSVLESPPSQPLLTAPAVET